MSLKKNKVKFNICNVHYALQIKDAEGNISFDTPRPNAGAVSLGLDPNGEPSNFYADGYAYYTISNNMGYEGIIGTCDGADDFRTDVLKEELIPTVSLWRMRTWRQRILHFFLSLTAM